jgi:hypothetical protein
VSHWHHFPREARFGPAAVGAHLKHLADFDLDFLKVMNDNGYPVRPPLTSAAQLRSLPVFDGGEEPFDRQLDLIRALAAELAGRVLMTSTIFNAWAVLRRLVDPAPREGHGLPALDGLETPADRRMSELLGEHRTAVAMALDAIAASLANFARRCVEAGADGIFLSVRDDWVDTPANGRDTYDEMVRTGDGQILSAVRGARFNMLHVCGRGRNFQAFAAYPAAVIHWADRAAGPAIRDVAGWARPAIAGGVDNLRTLPDGSPDDVEAEVRDAIHQAAGRPILIAPGCTYDPEQVPAENLHAMVRAAGAAAAA